MKTMTIDISIILTVFLMLLATNSYAQNKDKKLFLRVYTIQDEKIKGNIQSFNDSLLILVRGGKTLSIHPKYIKTIKTKRSGGGNIIIGAGIGALLGGVIGYSQGDDEPGWFSYSKEDYALAGVLSGALIGGGVGALTLTGKKSKKYIIDGDLKKWKSFLESENLQGP